MEIIQAVGVQVINILSVLLQIYSYVILARVILSWFLPPNNSILQFLFFLTEPVLAPIRKFTEPLMRKSAIPLDISPLIALLLLSVIAGVIRGLV